LKSSRADELPIWNIVWQGTSWAGGTGFEAVLNFRVAHLSRCVTGGAFDFDLLIENCTECNLTSITDASSNQTAFTYDIYGRVTQTNFPSSLSEYYQYDADNNLTQKTDRKGQTIQYLYDAQNRLTSKTYPKVYCDTHYRTLFLWSKSKF
jgi:YD repeat-containing protein